MLLKYDKAEQAEVWYAQKDKLTRKFIKKPVLMIPYNSTTFGIANYIERYFVNEDVFIAKNLRIIFTWQP